MANLPKNNAFGAGSPSWNLPFPDGNMTAAEILAYLPHWLKSIDVIDRFVTNGGRSATVAALINEFRHQPTGAVFMPNSAQIMMSYAMRRAGYKEWTVSTHLEWPREIEWSEQNLSVKGFRPPRLTHPKSVSKRNRHDLARNYEADPIDFKDLALHVKKHPSGDDALDLTRCVQYALGHENEDWLFPRDFERLVIHLGGPARITQSHHDKQVFDRRVNINFSPAKSAPKNFNRTPKGKATPRRTNMPETRIGRALSSALSSRSATPLNATPQKWTTEELGKVLIGSKRRSSRLVGKGTVDLCEDLDIDPTGKDFFDSPCSSYDTPIKKRKLSRVPSTPASPSNDSDFVQGESEPDDDVPEAEDASSEEVEPPTTTPRRAAAHRARQIIQSTLMSNRTPLVVKVSKLQPSPQKMMLGQPPKPVPTYMSAVISPETLQAAAQFSDRTPIRLAPPNLSANRLKVDSASIYLYAADGCATMAEMWASALSSSRFGGPRRHAPFRELHRLTDPDPTDASDWAENIRWAKEQHKVFGSETWTEYDYHLECITEHRREVMWVSEEAVVAGMIGF